MTKNIFIIVLFVCVSLIASAEAKVVDERIYLVPTENADKEAMEMIKTMLPRILSMVTKVEVLPKEKILESAYDPSRKQYNAEMLLGDISKRVPLATTRESALIISEVDLYSPGTDFVFGASDPSKVTGIISLKRLRNEFYNGKPDYRVFHQRALKEAMYELGHGWGLKDCPDQKCAMYLSKDISSMDKKRAWFCYECQNKLRKRYSGALIDTPSLTLIK